jgi:hypothetical protein
MLLVPILITKIKKTMFTKRRYLYFLPSLFWMAFIFFLSSQQTVGIGTTRTDRFLILKTFHLIEYALLFLFLYFALRQPRSSALFAYFYALSDELHQRFVPGREGRFVDTLIDLLGIFIGFLALRFIFSRRRLFKK